MVRQNNWDVCYLLCTVEAPEMPVKMHGLSWKILETQAKALGVPLLCMPLYAAGNDHYENQLARVLQPLRKEGINHLVFGDIFLEDIRDYRENLLTTWGWQCVFPLWKKDTQALMQRFVQEGFRALVCCVDTARLPPEMAGVEIDEAFLQQLPEGVDACGENGEYHSFCYDGPIFRHPVPVRVAGRRRWVMPLAKGTEKGPVFCQVLLAPADVPDGPLQSPSFL
jgi:uncharacterized protein (TIGR00290 family)